MRKKARKPIKYKVIAFKVTSRQKKSLENFCKSRKSTPIKVIKKAIQPLLDNYAHSVPLNNFVSVNQLELFKLD
jgi:hypothetical protein